MSSCVCVRIKKENLLSKIYMLNYIIEFNYLVLPEKNNRKRKL